MKGIESIDSETDHLWWVKVLMSASWMRSDLLPNTICPHQSFTTWRKDLPNHITIEMKWKKNCIICLSSMSLVIVVELIILRSNRHLIKTINWSTFKRASSSLFELSWHYIVVTRPRVHWTDWWFWTSVIKDHKDKRQ